MKQKRRMFLVILVSFILFGSLTAFALTENTAKTYALGHHLDGAYAKSCCNSQFCGSKDCIYDDDGLYDYTVGHGATEVNAERLGWTVSDPSGSDDCDVSEYTTNTPKKEGISMGCYFVTTDDDDTYQDDGFRVVIGPGFIFDKDWERIPGAYHSGTSFCAGSWWDGNNAAPFSISDGLWRSPTDKTYICADDQFWHWCDASTQDTVVWGDNILYNCTYEEDGITPLWQKIDVDYDHDGFTPSSGDCLDNPNQGPEYCKNIKLPQDCKYPQDSKCPICININAPEVCGDNLNNDCGGSLPLFEKNVNDKGGNTPDDCNLNQYACTKGGDPEAPPETPFQENVNDISFSWVDTLGGGYCCGYNGPSDHGKTIISRSQENYLCVNKNMVGSENDPASWEGKLGAEEWLLLKATDVDAQFKVLTLKVPGQQPFDVVSDSQNWRVCNASQALDVSGEGGVTNKYANHFFCYQEGEHRTWAECGNTDLFNQNVKGRTAGDGLYSLYLRSDTAGSAGAGETIQQGSQITISADDGKYNDIYKLALFGSEKTVAAKFDFSGYTHLEFFVRFINQEEGNTLKLPVDVNVTILGLPGIDPSGNYKEDEILLSKRVLGYTQNNPFLAPEGWMHIKVPIPNNLVGVSRVEISSIPLTDANQIQVKNVYLSNAQAKQICSGQNDVGRNSWLTSFDDGSSDTLINAQEMCKSHYGENAWLGNNEEVSQQDASCCGNTPGEYYSGNSKSGHGCWNSQPIAPGATTTNVEFDVSYYDTSVKVNYSSAQARFSLIPTYAIDSHAVPEGTIKSGGEVKVGDSGEYTFPKLFEYDVSYGISKIDLEGNLEGWYPASLEYDVNIINQSAPDTTYTTTARFLLNKMELVNNHLQTKIYFFNTLTGELIDGNLNSADLANGMKYYVVLAESREMKVSQETIGSLFKTFNHPCNQESCYFPLPGEPPYTITNPHPDLYQLWFVEEGKNTLITGTSTFNTYGILQARQVSQQIIYINTEAPLPENATEEEVSQDQNFYGCQAASYLEGSTTLLPPNNLPYCSVKGDLFCSPSVSHQVENEQYSTINSWSNESLDYVGYEEPQEDQQNASAFFENFELQLKDASISPEERNYSAPTLPGRNFLSNANFIPEKEELPHWKISPSPAKLKDKISEKGPNSNALKLNSGETLQSEKIALMPGQNLTFSQNSSCDLKVTLVNKDGNITEYLQQPNFGSENNSYLIIELSGPCELFQPQLQVIDDLGPNTYNYNDKIDFPRAGAACCPQDHCWNGYACVADMTKYTSLVENLGGDKFYRCVEGKWNHNPPKADWTYDLTRWGFCEAQSQCFVLSHNYGGDKDNTANDFYEGKYPTCINSSEYILDHYCDNGGWTSRTKFLAEKLLEVVNQDNDYQLYCDDYPHTLLDYTETENYLGGNIAQQIVTNTGDLLAEPTSASLATCFDKIMDGEGKRLVKDDAYRHENTCVNNFCVLKYREGGQDKVAFATTLNKPINDSSSFLLSLGVSQSALDTSCPVPGGEDIKSFVKCDLGEVKGELWYAPKLNAVIFARDGIAINPSWISTTLAKIGEWLQGLFGAESQLSSETRFVSEAQNYHQLYISNSGDRKIKALQEYFSEQKQTLVVEYENYETPVCEYLMNLKTPPELNVELFKEVSGEGKLNCSVKDNVQRVEAIAGLDFLWPQTTAQLRAEIK
jgi:hypothetical protein